MEVYYLDTNIEISVIIPVFNANDKLVNLVDECITTIKKIKVDFEIILVDDCSQNNSWEIIKEIKATHKNIITGIQLSKNYGQHNATLCGIDICKGENIITIDDDFEHSPKNILNLYEKITTEKYDLVYAYSKKKKNKIRNFLTSYFKILNKNKSVKSSSFRIFNKNLGKSILKNQREFSFIDEFFLWYTSKIGSIKVDFNKSVKTKSGYSILKLSKLAINIISLSSKVPLKTITFIGILMTGINFLLGAIIIIKKIFYSIDTPGYTSIIVVLLFSTGMIMYGIGVIADNLNTILKSSYNYPSYHVRKKI